MNVSYIYIYSIYLLLGVIIFNLITIYIYMYIIFYFNFLLLQIGIRESVIIAYSTMKCIVILDLWQYCFIAIFDMQCVGTNILKCNCHEVMIY